MVAAAVSIIHPIKRNETTDLRTKLRSATKSLITGIWKTELWWRCSRFAAEIKARTSHSIITFLCRATVDTRAGQSADNRPRPHAEHFRLSRPRQGATANAKSSRHDRRGTEKPAPRTSSVPVSATSSQLAGNNSRSGQGNTSDASSILLWQKER